MYNETDMLQLSLTTLKLDIEEKLKALINVKNVLEEDEKWYLIDKSTDNMFVYFVERQLQNIHRPDLKYRIVLDLNSGDIKCFCIKKKGKDTKEELVSMDFVRVSDDWGKTFELAHKTCDEFFRDFYRMMLYPEE